MKGLPMTGNAGHAAKPGPTQVKYLEREFKKNHDSQLSQLKKSTLLLAGVLTCILTLHILGVYLFLSGFLLTRNILLDKSQCADPPIPLSDKYTAGSVEKGCWHPKSFDKAIIIVVDALRYDFTVPFHAQNKSGSSQPYHDTLSLCYDLTVANPQQSILLPFIADPPTTTLQRIKGLTTGSLPTFIDAGSNFAGDAIEEDNLIAQLHDAGKNLVLLGDDTWKSLFPTYFDPELTRSYFSLTVEDLYTVDTGVTTHLFPLLSSQNSSRWDVLVGHYLGVDHAGHRYGPDHAAMTGKLQEMNDVLTRLVDVLDDNTLLVVMGDHGMDSRGNHGGESDDEVEAALWMYSKRNMFGRANHAHNTPPSDAKQRPVRQVDLVPTLSLLLGVPIPFNNLGRPIDDAFVSRTGSDFPTLAKVHRLTSAQMNRYQAKYSESTDTIEAQTAEASTKWKAALNAWEGAVELDYSPLGSWMYAHQAFIRYEQHILQACRERWASFDMIKIIGGITVLMLALLILGLFANIDRGDCSSEMVSLLVHGASGYLLGAIGAIGMSGLRVGASLAFCASMGCIMGMLTVLLRPTRALRSLWPRSVWSWCSVVSPLLLTIGLSGNSHTIWEDEILLFMLCTFGGLFLVASLRHVDNNTRLLGAWQSISFIVCTRLASLSRACREEQLSNCATTYYASASSTTSAWWQLMIPLLVWTLLPRALRTVFLRSKNYQGSAQLWLGMALPVSLSLIALYWILDAAESAEWVSLISSSALKTSRSITAQLVVAITYAAGYSTYIYAGAFVSVEERQAPAVSPHIESHSRDTSDPTADIFTSLSTPSTKPQLLVFGYANTHGTRFALLPIVWVVALLLVQKPMGQGSLALCLVSIFNLLEIIDVNDLRSSAVGPVVLALMGSFHFFKTGHQATLASIQWESAFVASKSVVYPWSPLFVTLNTLGPQILCAIAVPATVLWKIGPAQKPKELLSSVARAMAIHGLLYAWVCLATVFFSTIHRRHLMLYRVFMPRMLLGVLGMLVVDVTMILVGLSGVWWSTSSVSKTFERFSLTLLGVEGRQDTVKDRKR